MSSGSETTPPSQIHHRFTTDLLEIYPSAREHNFQKRREFRVLSDVLSDLDIRTGDVLEMTALIQATLLDLRPLWPSPSFGVASFSSGNSYPRGCLLRTAAKGGFRTCSSGGPSKSLPTSTRTEKGFPRTILRLVALPLRTKACCFWLDNLLLMAQAPCWCFAVLDATCWHCR